MRATDIRPTGVERHFSDDEIIVSKTDPRGILTYVNDVFLRVSSYEEADLIGKPHNVIRHPEMPRSVFELLWSRIASGNELFCYVVNLASDGGHYWVLAHVTPTFDATGRVVGYHSNRRTAHRSALAAVQPVYDGLLAAERAAGGSREALAAGADALQRFLADQGTTYDEWVWGLEPVAATEVAVR